MQLLAIIFLVSILLSSIQLTGYAEDKNEKSESEDEKEENEDDDNGVSLSSDVGNLILYGTITAIIASISYTVFKIASSRRKSVKLKLGNSGDFLGSWSSLV